MAIAFTEPARVKKYIRLRTLMMEHGVTEAAAAAALGISRATLCRKLNGGTEWTLGEAYTILDAFQVPHTRLGDIFPRDGIEQK